jgi:hypothetical protein
MLLLHSFKRFGVVYIVFFRRKSYEERYSQFDLIKLSGFVSLNRCQLTSDESSAVPYIRSLLSLSRNMFYTADDGKCDEKLLLYTSIMILRRHSPLYALVCLYFGQSVMPRRVSGELSLFHLLANRMRKSSKSSGPSIHRIRIQVRVTLLIGTGQYSGIPGGCPVIWLLLYRLSVRLGADTCKMLGVT